MMFNVKKDIDPEVLRNRSEIEGKKIFSKESTRRNRTLEECTAANMIGQAAEIHMLNHGGFIDDTRDYKDVIRESDGEQIEVKASTNRLYPNGKTGVDYQLEGYLQKMHDPRLSHVDFAKVIYSWIIDENTSDYTFNGIYKYDEKNRDFYLLSKEFMI